MPNLEEKIKVARQERQQQTQTLKQEKLAFEKARVEREAKDLAYFEASLYPKQAKFEELLFSQLKLKIFARINLKDLFYNGRSALSSKERSTLNSYINKVLNKQGLIQIQEDTDILFVALKEDKSRAKREVKKYENQSWREANPLKAAERDHQVFMSVLLAIGYALAIATGVLLSLNK